MYTSLSDEPDLGPNQDMDFDIPSMNIAADSSVIVAPAVNTDARADDGDEVFRRDSLIGQFSDLPRSSTQVVCASADSCD